ncbi:MAG: DUF2442 domain-containing protein [Bacteroides sp.]|nr:DUF2442 domain-containing protein [Ruminococcus flavefaciens]MCM1554562.1 DUF2442 domain-containing protein [Bacteroides sp.]
MIKVRKVWLTEDAVCIETEAGNVYEEHFADYPRLRLATPRQRQRYTLDATGIHWDELDEDLCFEGFLKPQNRNRLYQVFINHPELNAAAVARRLGFSQSLLAQYISGAKRPSPQREARILSEIRTIGKELAEELWE